MITISWGYLAYAFAERAFHISTGPVCLFHILTGHPCPFCGMTRAFGCLLFGDVSGAIHLNALSPMMLVVWIAMSLIYSLRAATLVKEALWGWRSG